MNITWDVRQSEFQGTPEVIASFSGYPGKFRSFFEEVLRQAMEDGYRVAMQEAPGAKEMLSKNQGHRIRDSFSIHRTTLYGTTRTMAMSLIANGTVAPQLKYTWEGTGLKGGGTFEDERVKRGRPRKDQKGPVMQKFMNFGDEEIFAGSRFARGMHKKLFNIQKEGHTGMQGNVRPRISGQAPQREWWTLVTRAVNARMRGALYEFDEYMEAAKAPPIAIEGPE